MHRSVRARILALVVAVVLASSSVPSVAWGTAGEGLRAGRAGAEGTAAAADAAEGANFGKGADASGLEGESTHAGIAGAETNAGDVLDAAVSSGAAVPGEFVVVLDDAAVQARALDAGASESACMLDDSGNAEGADGDATLDVASAEMREAIGPSSEVERLSDDALVVRADSAEQASDLADRLSQDENVAYVQPNYIYDMPADGRGTSADAERAGTSGDAAASKRTSDGKPAAFNAGAVEDAHATLDSELSVVPASATTRATTVNDPSWPAQDYLRAVGFDTAWDSVRTEGAVTVAMLDSTVNTSHEDLAGALDLEHAWDAAAQAPYGASAAKDHGTMVAGILSAACDNGLGIAGASYGATVLPVNVYQGSGGRLTTTTSVLLRAMEYVFSVADANPQLNVRVINLSLGGYGSGTAGATDRAFRDSVSEAVNERGMAVVASGGNENTSTLSWPADWDEVVSVTSVDATFADRAWFSDYNECKDLAAPGEDILGPTSRANDAYTSGNGTSYSTPIVSAALALLFAVDGSLTAQEAVDILYETADDLGVPGRDDEFGWGLLDVDEAVAAAVAESGKPSRAYRDVDQRAWYQTPVAYVDSVVGAGLMVGYEGLFRPDDPMTRAEAYTIAYRMAGAGTADEAPAENQTEFADNADGQFYTAAINWAAQRGIARGYDGLVRPNDLVTREELATIMARWAVAVRGVDVGIGSEALGLLSAFADGSEVSAWAVSSVSWACENGIMTGRVQPDGSALLAPAANVTRAETAKVVTQTLAATA